ncbi:MAG TPA: hypothetical protein PKX99_06505, partial [Thermoanaerobaculia bacterium]|nr:hypothetical protein [Thermoanaerobaculia bacterium]
PIGIPDRWVPHGSQEVLRKAHGLDAEGIYFRLRRFFAAGAGRAAADGERAPRGARDGATGSAAG